VGDELLKKVKVNLIIDHNADDDLITRFIISAVDYAESFQHKKNGYYNKRKMSPSTEQAVIMLSSHFYESRDGSTAGFFADNVNASEQVWVTVKRLLRMNKNWSV